MNMVKIGVLDEKGELLMFLVFYYDYKEVGYGMLYWYDSIYRFINTETMIRVAFVLVWYFFMVILLWYWERYNKGGYLCVDNLCMWGKYLNEGLSRA